MLFAFLPCMALQVFAYGRNQLPTTPAAVPAETPAPPAVPAQKPAPEPKAPPPAEEPGPGDFLDQFAEQYVGYTAKEIQTSSDRELLDKDGTPELSKLRTTIYQSLNDWQDDNNNVRSYKKYDALYHMKMYLEFLLIRLYPRASILEKMRNYWSGVDSDLKQELRSEFPAFEWFT